jgi:hypothetical protein
MALTAVQLQAGQCLLWRLHAEHAADALEHISSIRPMEMKGSGLHASASLPD